MPAQKVEKITDEKPRHLKSGRVSASSKSGNDNRYLAQKKSGWFFFTRREREGGES